jgi:hypothetical protein
MPLHTKKAFAALCGLTTGNLSNYAARKKIIYTGDFIDDSIEPNLSFLKTRQKQPIVPVFEYPPGIDKMKLSRKTTPPIQSIPESTPAPTQSPGYKTAQHELERIKTAAQIEKLEVETRLKLLIEQQKKGENIPTEIVKTIMAQLSKSFISKFQSAAENILLEIAKTKSLSRAETAQIRGRLIFIINDGTTAAVVDAQKQMRNVIRDLSIKRGIGEHE